MKNVKIIKVVVFASFLLMANIVLPVVLVGEGTNFHVSNVTQEFKRGNAEELYFYFYGDISNALDALKSGEANLFGNWIPPNYLNDITSDKIIKVGASSTRMVYLGFNLLRVPFDDINVREAIAQAINKTRVIQDAMHGNASILNHVIPETYGEWVNNSATLPGFDIDAANSLLDSVGYTDTNADGFREYTSDGIQGNGTNININLIAPLLTSSRIMDVALIVEDDLRSLGFNVTLIFVSQADFQYTIYISRDFDIFINIYTGGFYPNMFFMLYYSNGELNAMGYNNSEFDALQDEIYSLNLTREEQIELVKTMQAIVARDLPCVGLFEWINLGIYRSDQLSGVKPYVYGIVKWWTWYWVNSTTGKIKVAIDRSYLTGSPYHFPLVWDKIVWSPSKERLLYVDPDTYVQDNKLEYIPWLIENYSIIPLDADGDGLMDSQNITLNIRDGVTWQDGEKFDAHDINFTIYYSHENYWKLYTGPYFIDVDIFDNPPRITNKGMTISFINTRFEPFPEIKILNTFVLPEHVYRYVDGYDITQQDVNEHPQLNLGTGPWKFIEYNNQYIKYVRNNEYWKGGNFNETTNNNPNNDTSNDNSNNTSSNDNNQSMSLKLHFPE